MSKLNPLVRWLSPVLAIAALVPAVSFAGETIAQKANAEIIAFLRAHESGAAKESLYGDPVMVVGENIAKPERELAAVNAGLQKWRVSQGASGDMKCVHTLVEPFVASDTVFSSFMQVHCKANPPVLPKDVDDRLLVTWTKTSAGWRITLEMWAPGTL